MAEQMLVDKWEVTWTLVPGGDGKPDGVAGVALSNTPEGKDKSMWAPFSVSHSPQGAVIWWRRRSKVEALATSRFKALAPESDD